MNHEQIEEEELVINPEDFNLEDEPSDTDAQAVKPPPRNNVKKAKVQEPVPESLKPKPLLSLVSTDFRLQRPYIPRPPKLSPKRNIRSIRPLLPTNQRRFDYNRLGPRYLNNTVVPYTGNKVVEVNGHTNTYPGLYQNYSIPNGYSHYFTKLANDVANTHVASVPFNNMYTFHQSFTQTQLVPRMTLPEQSMKNASVVTNINNTNETTSKNANTNQMTGNAGDPLAVDCVNKTNTNPMNGIAENVSAFDYVNNGNNTNHTCEIAENVSAYDYVNNTYANHVTRNDENASRVDCVANNNTIFTTGNAENVSTISTDHVINANKNNITNVTRDVSPLSTDNVINGNTNNTTNITEGVSPLSIDYVINANMTTSVSTVDNDNNTNTYTNHMAGNAENVPKVDYVNNNYSHISHINENATNITESRVQSHTTESIEGNSNIYKESANIVVLVDQNNEKMTLTVTNDDATEILNKNSNEVSWEAIMNLPTYDKSTGKEPSAADNPDNVFVKMRLPRCNFKTLDDKAEDSRTVFIKNVVGVTLFDILKLSIWTTVSVPQAIAMLPDKIRIVFYSEHDANSFIKKTKEKPLKLPHVCKIQIDHIG